MVKSPLTNVLLVLNAYGFPGSLIVMGEPFV